MVEQIVQLLSCSWYGSGFNLKLIELDLLLELTYMDSLLNWNWFIIDKWINRQKLKIIELDIVLCSFFCHTHTKYTSLKTNLHKIYYTTDIRTYYKTHKIIHSGYRD